MTHSDQRGTIAIVWAGSARLNQMTIRLDRYAQGFRALGFTVTFVATQGCEVGFHEPVITIKDVTQLAAREFWESLPSDTLLIISWLQMSDYLVAAKSAGKVVIAIADKDGQESARLYFKARLSRSWVDFTKVRDKLRALRYCVRLWAYAWRDEDQEFIRSVESSDRVIFASEGALKCFVRCLRLHKRTDLTLKLHVAPYPIDSAFAIATTERRHRRAVAIGRWSALQKNGPEFARALGLYFAGGGDWNIVVIGGGGEKLFSSLTGINHFSYHSHMPPSDLAPLLRSSRVLLCPSLWEGTPVVAFEALASGCSIVSTPLPSVLALIEESGQGSAAASFKAPSIAEAMRREFAAWDDNVRHTDNHTVNWQWRLRPEAICAAVLANEVKTPIETKSLFRN